MSEFSVFFQYCVFLLFCRNFLKGWKGPRPDDKKKRGNEPYYWPRGWKKFAIDIPGAHSGKV